jgi:hypothetical protein
MRFHFITACTRLENLGCIGGRLNQLAQVHDLHWHLYFDPLGANVGGHTLKNQILDEIPVSRHNWIYILDDDTLPHPDLLDVARAKITDEVNALVFGQLRFGAVVQGCPDNLRLDTIDAGQALLRRTLVGEKRLANVYNGDGTFLVEVLRGAPGVLYLDQALSVYNALR